MRQDKIELLVFEKCYRLSCLQIGSLRKLLAQLGSCKHFFGVVAPRFLFKAIVEVFIHILAAIIIPRLGIVVKVILVDLW